MRIVKGVVVLVVFALLTAGLVGEAVGPATAGSLDLNDAQITDADLVKFVDLVFDRKLSLPETKAFYERLSAEQKSRVADLVASDLVASKLGLSLQEWQRMVEADKRQAVSGKRPVVPSGAGLASLDSVLWTQLIENGGPPSYYLPNSYWEDWNCDDDPNDRDFAYHYGFWYDQNADGLRWDTSDSTFWLYVHLFYGGNLKGYAYYWDEAYYCVGEGGAAAAGGSWWLSQKLYYRY